MKSGPLVAAIVIALITHLCLVYGLIAVLAVWLPAALAGILVGAVWNYAVINLYTWARKAKS